MPRAASGIGSFAKTTSGPATAAANTAVTVVGAALANFSYRVHKITCGYSATPTGGKITVAFGTGPTTAFELDLLTAGPFEFTFEDGLWGAPGEQMVVTLAAGSGTVVGKLNLTYS